MTDVVFVLLVELVITHRRAVHLSPKHYRLVQRQSKTLDSLARARVPGSINSYLEKKTELEPTEMLEMMILLQPIIQVPHTWCKVFPSYIVYHFSRDKRGGVAFCGLVI